VSDEFDLLGLSKTELYQQHLEMFGWPEWPPTEVPPYTEWWKQEKYLRVLPNRALNPITKSHTAEITGAPQTGKTTMEKALVEELKRKLKGTSWNLHVWEEGHVGGNERVFFEARQPLPYPYGSPEEDEVYTAMWDKEEDPWLTSLHMQLSKGVWWKLWIESYVEKTDSQKPNLVIGYRGPLDSNIWLYATAAHRTDPKMVVPDWYRKTVLPIWLPYIIDFELMTRHVDSIVITGVSQETAQERRRIAGKRYNSWITDSPIYKDYLAWLGYWIENVYPILHFQKGTGLLVVDGEDSLEANTQKLIDYVVEATGLRQ